MAMIDPQEQGESAGQEPAGGEVGFVDPAQESLSQALRTGFNLLRVIMIFLVVAYFLSGLFQVGPGQQGLIARLGKLRTNTSAAAQRKGTAVFGPGWHVSLPDPFDEKILISGATHSLQVDTFLYKRRAADEGKPVAEAVPQRDKIDPAVDGTMITGDRNLAHGLWTVEYRIEDAERFVRNIGERPKAFEPMLKRLLEAAVVETVAGLSVERVTVRRVDRDVADFTQTVKRRVQDQLLRFDTGVVVDKVTAETVEPGSVRDAFIDVTRAQNERNKSISDAKNQRVRILSQTAGVKTQYEPLLAAIDAYGHAQASGADESTLQELRDAINARLEQAGGQVAARLREAQSRASELRQKVEQEYVNFDKQRDRFKQSPRAVAALLWTDMRTAILQNKQNELFYVPDASLIEILTNRDEEKAIQREAERLKKKR